MSNETKCNAEDLDVNSYVPLICKTRKINIKIISNETTQTAVEWYGKQMGLLFQQFHWHKISITEFHYKRLELEEQAKEMEREQIGEAFTKGNRLDFYDATETIGEKYSKELYECQFEMDTSTSSATKCKFCGQEKWQHISGRI